MSAAAEQQIAAIHREFFGPEGKGVPALGGKTLQQYISDVVGLKVSETHAEATKRIKTRVAGAEPGPDGEFYTDTALGYAANADAYGNATLKELGGLRSLLEGLLQKLGDGGQVDVEAFRAMVREELPKLDVVVSVDRDDDPSPAA